MPWTITLAADTQGFEGDVQRLRQMLEQFGTSADNADKSLKRMAKAFDPEAIKKAGQDAVATIGSVENVSKLTDNQLRKLNGTLNESVQQFERMGKEVPASLRGMADAVNTQIRSLDDAKKKTTLWEGALGSVKTMAAGFVAGFTLDRVISGLGNAVKNTIALGDEIADLSDKTGVSTTALQRWRYAANQTGVSLDTLVGATQELNKRLGDGDKSTVAAVQALGLSFDALKRQSPEAQMETIASALHQVEDQTQQSALGADLFGKAWKEVIAPVRTGLKELGDEAERMGAVIDQETIAAMGKLSDNWQRLTDAGTGLIARALEPMVPLLNDLATGMARLASTKAPSWWEHAMMGGGMATGPVGMVTGLYAAGATAPKPAGGATAKPDPFGGLPGSVLIPKVTATEDWSWTQGDNVVQGVFMRDLVPAARASAQALRDLAASADGATRRRNNQILIDYSDTLMARQGATNMGLVLPGLENAARTLPNPWGGSAQITSAMGYSGPNFTRPPAGLNWSGAGAAGLGAAMPFLSQMIAGNSRSAQMGGSIGGGVGGGLGALFSGASGIMGSIAPFLGPVAGLLGGLIGRLFGPSRGAILGKEADQRMNDTRAGLLQQFGSLDAIAATGRAGQELVAGWGHKNVTGEKAFNELVKAFERQNGLLTEQKDIQSDIAGLEADRKALQDGLVTTWDQIVGIADKYKIHLEGLGTQVTQLGQTTTWTQMLNDIQALERAGADVGGILVGMSDEMSTLVQQSLRAGTEIPSNLKPYIESVAKAGKLLDENGDAITDLKDLKWGEPVKSQSDIAKAAMEKLDEAMEKLTTRLGEIVDLLANRIPAAAGTAAGAISGVTDPGPRVEAGDNSFASGSGGLRDFGTGTLAMLHGREAVLTEAQYRSLTGGGGFTVQPAPVILNGRVVGEVLFDVLPQTLRRAGLVPA